MESAVIVLIMSIIHVLIIPSSSYSTSFSSSLLLPPPLTSPGLAQWISEWPVSCLSYYDIIYPHYFVFFENFQGLDINFGKLLLVYFMSPPRPGGIGCYEAHWSLWPMGNLPPCSPRSGPDPHYFVYIVSRHG